MDSLKVLIARDKVNKVHSSKQFKKDVKFAKDVFVHREKSREDLRAERDAKYLAENFPDLESSYEYRVRSGK